MVLRANVLVHLCLVLLLAGCGSGRDVDDEALAAMAGGALKETVPVSGTVSVGGSPAAGVNIFAYTEESGTQPARQCRTGADGTYCWATYKECDGLQPGKYRLAFTHVPKEPKGNKEGEDLLKGKYVDPMKGDFQLTVESGKPQTDVKYELE